MDTRIEFCCEKMKKDIVQSVITMTVFDEVEIVTTNCISNAVAVIVKYCPHCGKKVTMKTGGK